jgi:hypothetical protein
MQPYRGLTRVISLTAVLSTSVVFVPVIIGQSASNQDQPQTKPSGQIWRRGDRGAFVDFIVSEGQIDENDQTNLAKGITPALPGKDWPDDVAHGCPLKKDLLTDMYYIALDTYRQVQEHDRQWQEYVDEWRHDPSRDLQTKIDQFNQERPKIYSDGIDRMKQELGDEDFATFSKCIDQIYGASAPIIVGRPAPPIPAGVKPPHQ